MCPRSLDRATTRIRYGGSSVRPVDRLSALFWSACHSPGAQRARSQARFRPRLRSADPAFPQMVRRARLAARLGHPHAYTTGLRRLRSAGSDEFMVDSARTHVRRLSARRAT